MHVFTTVSELQGYLQAARFNNQSVGLVATMGALHRGHISLIEAALSENEVVVCSIFVNPTQFNNPEDLVKYPRSEQEDLALLRKAGCQVAFVPLVSEMYPTPSILQMDFGPIAQVMEGKSRPGHFNGVGVVVSKLLHMIMPDRAYFGQKDLQQVAIVEQLIRDLSFSAQLVVCPTLREESGLAMSSRNKRLSDEELKLAALIYQKLAEAKNQLLSGISIPQVIASIEAYFNQIPEFRLDYFEIVDRETLQRVEGLAEGQSVALCIAIYLGDVRLIDNLVID
ncbi:pantoate--beta-alanine ligase [Dyadobacter jejuensis]|uniref:Pantothenate synthetase n=1 Tax=Dyadobacter jejuensis TaxID=1082580 RepID=A0A316BCZ5_9BACT|nr:pantoate--beta-alanine ligase [Dyadobacter jejuensis]PWJ60337.1 pantoate--beta-alanine ligase [Dyadobacter jejuensis]